MVRAIAASAALALCAAAPGWAQGYDLYVIENTRLSEQIFAVAAPDDDWAAIRLAGLAAELIEGDVAAPGAEAAPGAPAGQSDSDEERFQVVMPPGAPLAFAREEEGGPSDLVAEEGGALVYVRVTDASQAEARDFVDALDDAPAELRATFRELLGL